MAGRISQPVGQVRLTNVAVVRFKRNGIRFEIAAYPGKVRDWRARVETDLSEVLQSSTVFTNVSKGAVAKAKQLVDAFGTDDHDKVAVIILERGELEVSEKERAAALEAAFLDVATIVASKCVNPETQRPYTVTMIERALRDSHFAVNPAKPAKQQALKAISLLRKHYAIERARMRVRMTVATADAAGVRAKLVGMGASVEGDAARGTTTIVLDAVIDPGSYRLLEEEVARLNGAEGAAEAAGGEAAVAAGDTAAALAPAALASLEVLALAVTADAEGGRSGGGAGAAAGGAGGTAGARRADSDDSEGDDSDGSDDGAAGATAPARPVAAGAGAGGATAVAAGKRRMDEVGSAGGAGTAADDAAVAAERGTGMVVRRVAQPGRRLHCGTCDVGFEDAAAHREHARSDLHRFNLKRKLRGMAPVPAEAFDAIPERERTAFVESYDD